MALLVPALEDVLRVVVSATAIYVLLITWSRLVGPRSFSRMTASDMGVTVALERNGNFSVLRQGSGYDEPLLASVAGSHHLRE